MFLGISINLRSAISDESTVENHSDDAFAPVAFLKVQKASLQDKLDFTPPSGRPITYKDTRFMRGESLKMLDHLEALSLPSTHVNTPDGKGRCFPLISIKLTHPVLSPMLYHSHPCCRPLPFLHPVWNTGVHRQCRQWGRGW
jgi:hypothetical protein